MLPLIGNIGKAHKVRSLSCLHDQRNSHHFLKLGAWRTVKILPQGAPPFEDETDWKGSQEKQRTFPKAGKLHFTHRSHYWDEWQNLLTDSRSFSLSSLFFEG